MRRFIVTTQRQKMLIKGAIPLRGSISAQGAKNAALPIMAASLLLSREQLIIDRIPDLQDTRTMADLLGHLGAHTTFEKGTMTITAPEEPDWETPAHLVRKMRASSLALGPLLARCGRAVLPLPGGCAIGGRPIDLHLKGLAKMGAQIELVHGSVHAKAKGLRGCRIYLDFPSVGATENLMMAAVFARGQTILENVAREPEITNLAEVLRAMGARIEGEGTGTIRITGVRELSGTRIAVIPDRVEASTYLLAGIMTGGEITVHQVIPQHMDALLAKLEEAGAEVFCTEETVSARAPQRLRGISVKTLPFPGFPTDLQPQMMALLSIAEGSSIIQEGIFESRFLHVPELQRMGAHVDVQGNSAVVTGVPALHGTDVQATDLRAGAALILAGLSASDQTEMFGVEHVARGYEKIVEKLSHVGARVEIIPCPEEDA